MSDEKIKLQKIDDYRWMIPQEGNQGHEDAGCTEPALYAVRFPERGLQGMQLAAVTRTQGLHGGYLLAVRLDGEYEARAHRFPVEQDGAGAADAVFAADVRAGEPQRGAEKVGEEQAWLHLPLVRHPVHRDADRVELTQDGLPVTLK